MWRNVRLFLVSINTGIVDKIVINLLKNFYIVSAALYFEKSLTPYPANALIGTSSSSQILVGNGAVSQITSKLLYNPVLKLPVKYPNLTDSENKFLNDYMGKEIPGKIVSKMI